MLLFLESLAELIIFIGFLLGFELFSILLLFLGFISFDSLVFIQYRVFIGPTSRLFQ